MTLAGGLALVLVGALPAWDVHLVPESIKSRFHFRWNTDQFRSEFGQWAYMADNVDLTSQFGRIMKEISAPGDSIVADSLGALGYYSDLFVYDLYGLVSREVTRADRARGRLRSPGHDLRVPPAFFLPYGPTYLEPITVPHGPEAARTIRAWADKWQQRVDPNLYAPEIVNTGRITGNPQAPLLAVLRRPRNGVSAEQMWSRFQTDLRLWSVTFD